MPPETPLEQSLYLKAVVGNHDGFFAIKDSPLTNNTNQHTILTMVNEKQNLAGGKADNAASLSSTMPISLEESPAVSTEMRLTVRFGSNMPPKVIPMERQTYMIGRQDGTDIHIPDPGVSRQHARIFYLHKEEIIEDLNSTNGTFVNGVRVTHCVLQDNDIIRIGDTRLLFSRATTSNSPADKENNA